MICKRSKSDRPKLSINLMKTQNEWNRDTILIFDKNKELIPLGIHKNDLVFDIMENNSTFTQTENLDYTYSFPKSTKTRLLNKFKNIKNRNEPRILFGSNVPPNLNSKTLNQIQLAMNCNKTIMINSKRKSASELASYLISKTWSANRKIDYNKTPQFTNTILKSFITTTNPYSKHGSNFLIHGDSIRPFRNDNSFIRIQSYSKDKSVGTKNKLSKLQFHKANNKSEANKYLLKNLGPIKIPRIEITKRVKMILRGTSFENSKIIRKNTIVKFDPLSKLKIRVCIVVSNRKGKYSKIINLM